MGDSLDSKLSVALHDFSEFKVASSLCATQKRLFVPALGPVMGGSGTGQPFRSVGPITNRSGCLRHCRCLTQCPKHDIAVTASGLSGERWRANDVRNVSTL